MLKHRPLGPAHLDSAYPEHMPFYLYGTPENAHLEHILLHAPNTQLSAGDVQLRLDLDLNVPGNRALLVDGLVATLDAQRERSMQPLAPGFFAAGRTLAVTVYRDARGAGPGWGAPLARGSVTLGARVWADGAYINAEHVWTDEPAVAAAALGVAACGWAGVGLEPELDVEARLGELEAAARRVCYVEVPRAAIHRKVAAIGAALAKEGVGARDRVDASAEGAVPSRYVVQEPDERSAKRGVLKGWKEEFEAALASRVF